MKILNPNFGIGFKVAWLIHVLIEFLSGDINTLITVLMGSMLILAIGLESMTIHNKYDERK
ncbi:hypothetical protein M3175_07980 [Robertmurraya korlensis]|jgi:hypothetical protein|uniref:hypothetical protein n=1 Tax=Robertmurraya korlensis TaxID=519977 RepID=UPI00203FB8E6|nr:hypothetical protein [Robertmurraya korlensis]MCM3600666.1 hypothetical protein [Robertmurraya korlensis]